MQGPLFVPKSGLVSSSLARRLSFPVLRAGAPWSTSVSVSRSKQAEISSFSGADVFLSSSETWGHWCYDDCS